MQAKQLFVLIHIRTKDEVDAPLKIVSEYDQEISQSQTTVNPMAPRGRATHRFKPSRKIFLLTVPRRCFFCGSFMLFLSCFVMRSCTSFC